MKGILLAGGYGTRLYPLTKAISKHLLAIFDKPIIYYPLSILLTANIRDILIITTPQDLSSYQTLLGDGSQWGICIRYKIQPSPDGLAQAFILGEHFIGDDNVCLILGDNFFHHPQLENYFSNALSALNGAMIFGYPVQDPRRYGIVELDKHNKPLRIIEKPEHPPSNYAIIGLYFYNNEVVDIAKKIKPSQRGELEITDVNNCYLAKKHLTAQLLDHDFAWWDVGTPTALLEATQYVANQQKKSRKQLLCPEEIAWRKKYISSDQLLQIAQPLAHTDYGRYLIKLI